MMRVISMVPSLTETLLSVEDTFKVIARTRYCVHPSVKVSTLPVVGGTKDIDWDSVQKLQPDLLIFEKEENPRKLAEECPMPWEALHVQGVHSMSPELSRLAEKLNSPGLQQIADRWKQICRKIETKAKSAEVTRWNFQSIPGELENWVSPRRGAKFEKIVYVIWRKPWMCVSKETFIGSQLIALGAGAQLPDFKTKYPEFNLEDYDLSSTYFLFSSEPFPFAKFKQEILSLGIQGASLVDGELYSWFGTRSLEFMESLFP